MPRKKKPILQPNLFDNQLTESEIAARQTAAVAFELFQPEVEKCHRLQDAPKSTGGNCYFWWRSRYSEWLHDSIKEFERRSKFDQIFKEVWQMNEMALTRSRLALGLPDDAF